MIEPVTINPLGEDIVINPYTAYINDNGVGRFANLKYYKDSGVNAKYDIISEYQESIDEDELNRIKDEWWQTAKYQSNLGYYDCFDAGYHKALSVIGINYENDYQ